MSEKLLTYTQLQQKTKPKIEDIIGDLLEGDRLKNALDLISYLKENKINSRWSAQNCWGIFYKGKGFTNIRIRGVKQVGSSYGLEPGSWHIGRHWFFGFNLSEEIHNEFEDSISFDRFKEFIWANVTPCKKCMCCAPGCSGTYLGKKFDSVCGFRIENPDAEALAHTKWLIEYYKNVISGNGNSRTK